MPCLIPNLTKVSPGSRLHMCFGLPRVAALAGGFYYTRPRQL